MTLSQPPLLRDGALFIDNTTFEALTTCHRLAEYKILWKRELDGKASALHFGGALHAGLDVRYKSGGKAIDSLVDQQRAACAYLDAHPVDFGDYRTNDLACDVLKQYALTFPLEEFVVESQATEVGEGTLAPRSMVELPFAVPLGSLKLAEPLMLINGIKVDCEIITRLEEFVEIPVVWTGKIDLVLQRDGQLWFMDHKSTSIAGPTYFDQFRLSNQMTGYAWALSRMLNQSISGVGINMLGVKRPKRDGSCTVEFAREWIRIPRHAVDEWHRNTLEIIGDFFVSLARSYFPQEMMWCTTKFMRKCDYFDVCTLPPEHRDAMFFSGAFKPITWSPLD